MGKSLAFHLSWLPDSLTSDPAEDDAAVCNGEDSAGKPRDHSYAGFIAQATNWDALLDTAGVPTDGTPPDPLESKRLAEQMGIPSLDEMSQGKGPGGSAGVTPAQPGVTSPVQNLPPAPPGAQKKATERAKRGRGVEGNEVGPANPMDNSDPYDWDNLPVPEMAEY